MNTVWHSEPMDVERREQFSNSNLTIPVCLLSPKIGTKGCEGKKRKSGIEIQLETRRAKKSDDEARENAGLNAIDFLARIS